MAGRVEKAKIVLKHRSSNEWIAQNPVLLKGEPGWEEDTNKIKVGDGVTNWINLPYTSNGNEIISYETLNQNLKDWDSTIFYNLDGSIDRIEYTENAATIIKTFNYTGDLITSIVLSGSIPFGVNTTKTFSYTGDNLTGIFYS